MLQLLFISSLLLDLIGILCKIKIHLIMISFISTLCQVLLLFYFDNLLFWIILFFMTLESIYDFFYGYFKQYAWKLINIILAWYIDNQFIRIILIIKLFFDKLISDSIWESLMNIFRYTDKLILHGNLRFRTIIVWIWKYLLDLQLIFNKNPDHVNIKWRSTLLHFSKEQYIGIVRKTFVLTHDKIFDTFIINKFFDKYGYMFYLNNNNIVKLIDKNGKILQEIDLDYDSSMLLAIRGLSIHLTLFYLVEYHDIFLSGIMKATKHLDNFTYSNPHPLYLLFYPFMQIHDTVTFISERIYIHLHLNDAKKLYTQFKYSPRWQDAYNDNNHNLHEKKVISDMLENLIIEIYPKNEFISNDYQLQKFFKIISETFRINWLSRVNNRAELINSLLFIFYTQLIRFSRCSRLFLNSRNYLDGLLPFIVNKKSLITYYTYYIANAEELIDTRIPGSSTNITLINRFYQEINKNI